MPRSSSSLRSESSGSMTTKCSLVEVEMALDQRQRAAADRAEADHHDRAFDAPMFRPVRHWLLLRGLGFFERNFAALKPRARRRVNRAVQAPDSRPCRQNVMNKERRPPGRRPVGLEADPPLNPRRAAVGARIMRGGDHAFRRAHQRAGVAKTVALGARLALDLVAGARELSGERVVVFFLDLQTDARRAPGAAPQETRRRDRIRRRPRPSGSA